MAMPARRDPERCNSVCAQESTEIDFPNSVQLVPQRGCYGNRKSLCTKGVCAQSPAGPGRPGNLGWKVRSGLLLGRRAGCRVEVGGEGMRDGGDTWVKGRLGRW